jgi:hypothetical protein
VALLGLPGHVDDHNCWLYHHSSVSSDEFLLVRDKVKEVLKVKNLGPFLYSEYPFDGQ